MSEKETNEKRGVLAIVGGMVLGVGVGLFFFPGNPANVFIFTGCIVGGLGLGMLTAAVLTVFDRG